jgi:Cysteine-rich CPCC
MDKRSSDDSMVSCPCCGFPTLSERAVFEICLICWWEDDGQTDHNADSVLGGPNSHYSLAQARRNFLAHGHMYDKGNGIDMVEKPTPARQRLLSTIRAVIESGAQIDQAELDAVLLDCRNDL